MIINPNLIQLCRSYNTRKRGTVLLGSSRSGKTYAAIDFLIWLCSKHLEKKTIYIVRETYASFKTTLYKDFNTRLPMFGIASPFERVQECSSFKLFTNTIHLLGADNAAKFMGAGSDILWFNEGIHIPKSIFDQLEMRCSGFFIIDSNPEESEHWIYDNVITRSDVDFLKTTFLDNPFCPPAQKKKILSYEPTPENYKEGTADEYMWQVFGLGLKAEKKGRIYKKVYTYEDLPSDAWHVGFGGDFGYNPDPTVVVDVYCLDNNLYIRECVYGTELDPAMIAQRMRESGIKDYSHADPDDIVFDSAEPLTIAYLKNTEGFRIWKPKKGSGSVQSNIRMLSRYKLHIHSSSKNALLGFENFCWKWNDLLDCPTGEPEKKHKHFSDATAYVVSRAIGREE